SKLLAPAMPFLADELYQNLVRSVDETAAESVHLAEWPKVLPEMIDESLNRKVRQPLAEVAFSLGNTNERKAVETYADLFLDELNVKHVRLLDNATEA